MEVVEVPIERVVPYTRNPRRNTDAIATVAGSIAEFGWRQPIVVDEQMVIVAGHTRYEAAKRLGFKTVPIHIATGLTPAQVKAYRLMDNRAHENAEWDNELLKLEFADLKLEDIDLALTGFDEAELDRLLAELDGADAADEAPAPPVEPVSRIGDLWICGEHRVLCGDATVLSDLEKVLGGELADMCFCDPPYRVSYQGSPKDKMRGKKRAILNDDLGKEDFAPFLYDACVNILTVTKGAVYICMSSSELDTLQKAFREAGGHWSTFIIWAKNAFTIGRSDYQHQFEPMVYGWKEGNDHYWCGARDQGNVWFFDRPTKNDLHPTMKPVALVERAIRNSSKTKDIILDPFGGSGTTMIAAERAGRRARLIELDPKYVDVIVERWQNQAGGHAKHAATGQAFNEAQSAMR